MDKLTLFAKVQNALYKCAVSNSEIPNNSTTKNYLGVDLIDREMAIEGAWEIELAGLDNKKVVDMLKDLPLVTIKNDLGVDNTINGLDDFIEFGKKAFGVELIIKRSDNPDTYAKLFGTTKNDLGVDCISRTLVQSAISKSIEYKENPYQLYKRIERLPSLTPKNETITYLDGFADGLNMANNSTNKMLDKIRAEIVELTKCPYGTECLGANCPSNTDCMICGDHVLDILDKYKAETEVEDG